MAWPRRPVSKHLGPLHDQRTHGRNRLAGALRPDVISFIKRNLKTKGGLTAHRFSGYEPTEGYSVALDAKKSLEILPNEPDEQVRDEIIDWINRNTRKKGPSFDDKKVFIGGWVDPDTGHIWMDVVSVWPPDQLDAAKKAALAANQIALYDLKNGREVPIGGTGKVEKRSGRQRFIAPFDADPEELADWLIALRNGGISKHLAGLHSQRTHGRRLRTQLSQRVQMVLSPTDYNPDPYPAVTEALHFAPRNTVPLYKGSSYDKLPEVGGTVRFKAPVSATDADYVAQRFVWAVHDDGYPDAAPVMFKFPPGTAQSLRLADYIDGGDDVDTHDMIAIQREHLVQRGDYSVISVDFVERPGNGDGPMHVVTLASPIAKKFSPNQLRIPKGMPGGGRWMSLRPKVTARRWQSGDPKKSFQWQQPDNWYVGTSLQDARVPTADDLIPTEPDPPTDDDLWSAASQWKGDPSQIRMFMDDVLEGNGVPPWRTGLYVESRRAAAALLNKVATAPPSTVMLQRGMRLREDDPLLKMKVGDEFDWKPSGFTSDRITAIMFSVSEDNDDRIGVIYKLAPGARAYDLEKDAYSGSYNEDEHVVAGRFRIIDIEVDPEDRDAIEVTIEQVRPLGMPDDGGIWKGEWNWTEGPGPMALSRPKKKRSPIETALQAQYLAGVKAGLADPLVNRISKADVDPNDIIEEAREYARREAGAMIANVKNTRIIQTIISRSIDEDWPEKRLQAAIGRSVGLDPRSQVALANYEKKLVKDGLPPGRIRRQTDAYSKTLKDRRVKTIANNERASAYAAGKRATWRRMKSMGEISPYAVRVWRTHKDERTCKVCGPLNGRRASIDDGRGYRTGPADKHLGWTPGTPAHVNCRCWEELIDEGKPLIP